MTQSVDELSKALQKKSVSPVELTEKVLAQAEKTEPTINAYMDIYYDEAIASAKQAEEEIIKGNYKGMYHGIPMGIKDNLYMKDKITTMSSKIHQNFKSNYDATVITQLREAGVIFTGKLSMHEYASGITNNNPHFGPVRNPWNTERIPGGSSGGSGAAVAAGSSVASLGTDTAGSIRIPSAACGIVGLKPTHGLVSKYGCFPLSWSLDHVGPMAKTVKDTAGLLTIIAQFDPNDPTSIRAPKKDYATSLNGHVKDLVIGIEEDFFFNQIDTEVNQTVRSTIQKLVDEGAKVQPVKIPSLQYAHWMMYVTFASEAATAHVTSLKERPEDFGQDVRLFLELGNLISAVDYLQAQQVRRQLKVDFQKAFEQVDVLISPTLPIVSPEIGLDMVKINNEEAPVVDTMTRLSAPADLTGIPALTVPCGLSEGLPIGLQIMGPALSESLLLNVGYAVEKMNLLNNQKPNILINV